MTSGTSTLEEAPDSMSRERLRSLDLDIETVECIAGDGYVEQVDWR